MAGLSFPFSYAKQLERGMTCRQVHLKLLKRMLALVFLGWVYQGFFKFDFSHFRYASVLGRIGDVLAEAFGTRYIGDIQPTSDGLKAFAEKNPSVLVREPLPIYLNPAVRD